MKRPILLLVALGAIVICSQAQAPLGKGNAQLNAGFGFSTWGVPLYAGADFGVHPDITIGPQISFQDFNENYTLSGNKYRYNHSIVGLAFDGNYHFNRLMEIPNQWDFYAGLTLGYYIWSNPNDYLGTYGSKVGLAAQVGGRYFWSPNFGVNLEFGGGYISGGKIGITYIF